MNKIRNRAAQIRSRWLRIGLTCELTLDELEPLFSVYADNPRGKIFIVDKALPITLENLKSLTYAEYQTYKLDVKALSQATAHHSALSRFKQPILVSVYDIYKLIRNKLDSKQKSFSLKNSNSPITMENLTLLSDSRSDYFYQLRNNAEQKIIFWRKHNYNPQFSLSQLTELMEDIGYQIVSSKKGLVQRERIRVKDKSEPLTLGNLEILVNTEDEVRLSM
jgi:hypothetical protein